MIIYCVGEEGAAILDYEHNVIERIAPGTLIAAESVEAIDPADAFPIQTKLRASGEYD